MKNKSETQPAAGQRLILTGVISLGVVLLLIAILIVTMQGTLITPLPTGQDNNFTGITRIDPPRPMPNFTLTDQYGEPLELYALRGKFTLFTFGFTHCPDVCPLTLNDFQAIQRELGVLADDVNFVFISVDGKRDTPEVLKNYFAQRDLTDFIAMTGTETALREIGTPYNLQFVYGEPDANGNYSVDHTAGSFLLDSAGRWVARYVFGIETSLIVDDMRILLES
jgi:protein SCO1/2